MTKQIVGRNDKSWWKHEHFQRFMGRQLPVLAKRGRGLIVDMHAGDGEATPHKQADLFSGGALITTPHLALSMADRWGADVWLCERSHAPHAALVREYGDRALVLRNHDNLSQKGDEVAAYPWVLVLNDPNGHSAHGVEVMRSISDANPCSDFIINVNRGSIQRHLGVGAKDNSGKCLRARGRGDARALRLDAHARRLGGATWQAAVSGDAAGLSVPRDDITSPSHQQLHPGARPMSEQVIWIEIAALQPHPANPRIEPRLELIEQLALQMAPGFDPSHALIVRPMGDGYQIISGHNRVLAAQKAGWPKVPCWVRELDDDEAYMQLVLCNTQSELHPLEEGLHAMRSGKVFAEYGREVNKSKDYLRLRVNASEVMERATRVAFKEVRDAWRNLAEIHAAPQWLWSALVAQMLADGWTVAQTRAKVAELKETADPAGWMDAEALASALITGTLRPAEIQRMERAYAEHKVRDEDLREALFNALAQAQPWRFSEVLSIVNDHERQQAERDAAAKAAEIAKQRAAEDASMRITSLRANCSLDQWKDLSEDERSLLLVPPQGAGGTFNQQTNEAIEWAQWSWNPVTGCKHDCPYCYARDIALSERMSKTGIYPNGWEPTFRSNALNAPGRTRIPKESAQDTRYRNVFTCSMADLFGRWVPLEWINAVLSVVRDSPEWNFLFLTKFPNRLSEIEIPDNAWMGTTVDLQARVANAEKAFERVGGKVKWLSVEPMIEPLRFSRLDLFDWVVIGGASSSSKTPAWRPPFAWIYDLVSQARDAGCKIYMKTNLFGDTRGADYRRGSYSANPRIVELPFDAPVIGDQSSAPDAFHYLGRGE